MKHIFVNLKRFDVPIEVGGVCSTSNPGQWIEQVMAKCVDLKLGELKRSHLTFFLPEGLILHAQNCLSSFDKDRTATISLGSQGVYRENVEVGGNFGAFTTLLPAAAARNLGAKWAIIGHSEERKDKFGIISTYNPEAARQDIERNKANSAIHRLLNAAIHRACESDLNVVYCVGETMEDKGEGEFAEQKPRIEQVIKKQLLEGLRGIEPFKDRVVIAYEPIWAIGPGKTPPDSEYIAFVADWIQQVVRDHFNFRPSVVYGGGLKTENAKEISTIGNLDGGLIALTNFVGQPGFTPEGLREIIDHTMWEAQ